MIPVARQKEPGNFAEKLGKKADAFLKNIPEPTKENIDSRPWWRYVLDDLFGAYGRLCAYCGLRFQRDAVCVDHFTPISKIWRTNPKGAYEWSNFRLASQSMNNEKKDYQDVVDPFHIEPVWFVIDFPSMIIKSGPGLAPADKAKVDATILRLKLNNIEKRYIHYRRELIRKYCDMARKWGRFQPALDVLDDWAPFIAFELKRQALTEQIIEMLKYPERR
jgi:hypothetical protein